MVNHAGFFLSSIHPTSLQAGKLIQKFLSIQLTFHTPLDAKGTKFTAPRAGATAVRKQLLCCARDRARALSLPLGSRADVRRRLAKADGRLRSPCCQDRYVALGRARGMTIAASSRRHACQALLCRGLMQRHTRRCFAVPFRRLASRGHRIRGHERECACAHPCVSARGCSSHFSPRHGILLLQALHQTAHQRLSGVTPSRCRRDALPLVP